MAAGKVVRMDAMMAEYSAGCSAALKVYRKADYWVEYSAAQTVAQKDG